MYVILYMRQHDMQRLKSGWGLACLLTLEQRKVEQQLSNSSYLSALNNKNDNGNNATHTNLWIATIHSNEPALSVGATPAAPADLSYVCMIWYHTICVYDMISYDMYVWYIIRYVCMIWYHTICVYDMISYDMCIWYDIIRYMYMIWYHTIYVYDIISYDMCIWYDIIRM